MSWPLPLYAWQRAGVVTWSRTMPLDYLVFVTPGAGKTRLALAIAYGALRGGHVQQVLCVVPTTSLKTQWAVESSTVGIHLDPQFHTRLPRDMNGAAVTYSQVMTQTDDMERFVRSRRTLVIVDEIHHAGLSSPWGLAMLRACRESVHRLNLSGTPFRTGDDPVAFLKYTEAGIAIPDVSYSYRHALADGVVRPVVAYPQSAVVEWIGADGIRRLSSFEDSDLATNHAAERLRAALEDEGWLGSTLERSHSALMRLRNSHKDLGAIAIARTAKHARKIAGILRARFGINAPVVLGEDPDSDGVIASFRHSRDPWIVAVRKVSEGVDIPRLGVMAYLTNARTELLFRQLVGRIIRRRSPADPPGYLFFPSDPILMSLVRDLEADVIGVGKQSSSSDSSTSRQQQQELSDDDVREIETLSVVHRELEALRMSVESVDPLSIEFSRPVASRDESLDLVVRSERKQALRKEISKLVRAVAFRHDIGERDIHGHFAKSQKVGVEHATLEQLEDRVGLLQQWERNVSAPVLTVSRKR